MDNTIELPCPTVGTAPSHTPLVLYCYCTDTGCSCFFPQKKAQQWNPIIRTLLDPT